MRRFILTTALLLSIISVSLFLSLSGIMLPAGVREAAAAGENFTWTDTGGEVGDFGIAALAWDGAGLYAGTAGHGVWRYDPASGVWTEVNMEETDDTYVLALAWSGSHLYASCLTWPPVPGEMEYRVWSYEPASGEWTDISLEDVTLAADLLAWGGGSLYAAAKGMGVWRYDPGAMTWTKTGGALDNGSITILSLAWGDSALYAGGFSFEYPNVTGTGVWRYQPLTGTWANISGASGVKDMVVKSLAWDGSSLYAGCASYVSVYEIAFHGVWRHDPVSGSWTDTGGDVSGSLAISLARASGGVFAGAIEDEGFAPDSGGLFFHDPAAGAWMDATWPSTDGPCFPVCLAWDGKGRLYAGTLSSSDINNAYVSIMLGVPLVYDGDGVWYCEVAFSAPALASVAPDRALQFTVWQDVTLEGEGFRAGARAWLEKDGEKATEAFNLKVASDTRITCTLGLFGLAPGAYDLVVENPDGQRAVLEGGFTVSPICGSGSGTALLPLGVALGLLSAGSLGLRRRGKKGKKQG